jgi:hypothetical protein
MARVYAVGVIDDFGWFMEILNLNLFQKLKTTDNVIIQQIYSYVNI